MIYEGIVMRKHYISGIIIFVLGTTFSTNVFAEGDMDVEKQSTRSALPVMEKMVKAKNTQMPQEFQVNIPGI